MQTFAGRKLNTKEELVSWVDEMKTRERRRNRSVWLDWLSNLAAFHGRPDIKLDSDLRPMNRMSQEQRQDLQEIAVNWVQPYVRTMVAQILKTRPIVEALPFSSDEDDVQAAKVGDKVLESEWITQSMNTNKMFAWFWAASTGNGYLHTYFDKDAGESVQDEQGNSAPIGEIKTECVNPFKLLLEPHRESIKDCRWAIMSQKLPKDQIIEKYGDAYSKLNNGKPLTLASANGSGKKTGTDYFIDSYLAVIGFEHATEVDDGDYCDIDTLYHLPCKLYPKGLYAIIAGNELIYGGAYPYPFLKQLPFCHFVESPAPWRFYGETGCSAVLKSQEHFMMLRRMERTYLRKYTRGKWLIPTGLRIRREKLTSHDPNDDFIPYTSSKGTLKPEFVPGRDVPSSLYTAMQQSTEDANKASGLNEASQGASPSGVSSGRAILALQEMDATRFSIISELAEVQYAFWGHMTLLMVREFYNEKRKYQIAGTARKGGVWFFDKADLKSTNDVRCVPGSAFPRNKVAKQEQIRADFAQGILGNPQDPQTLVTVSKMLEYGMEEDFYDDNGLDEQVAEKENISMLSMVDQLEKSQQITPQNLQMAVMPVGQYDNDLCHVKIHMRRWKSAGIRDIQIKAQTIGAHIAMHMQRLMPPAPDQQVQPNQEEQSESQEESQNTEESQSQDQQSAGTDQVLKQTDSEQYMKENV